MSGTATIRKVIDSYMETFETGFPGTISAVNGDGTIDALPSVRNALTNLQQEGGGGDVNPMRAIPVLWPGTATAIVRFELSKGDPVWLISGSRDQSVWADGDWADAVKDPFRAPSFGGNDLNSLVAIPVRWESHGSGNPKITVTVKKDGKVEIETAADIAIKAGTLDIEGDLKLTGKIEATGEITAMAGTTPVNLSTHIHASSAGPTESPTPNT